MILAYVSIGSMNCFIFDLFSTTGTSCCPLQRRVCGHVCRQTFNGLKTIVWAHRFSHMLYFRRTWSSNEQQRKRRERFCAQWNLQSRWGSTWWLHQQPVIVETIFIYITLVPSWNSRPDVCLPKFSLLLFLVWCALIICEMYSVNYFCKSLTLASLSLPCNVVLEMTFNRCQLNGVFFVRFRCLYLYVTTTVSLGGCACLFTNLVSSNMNIISIHSSFTYKVKFCYLIII